MADGAVRAEPSSRRARTGARAGADDARVGGAVMGRTKLAAAAVSLALVVQYGCAKSVQPDAYGNVEATEVVVGAEASGRLLTFTVAEGAAVAANSVVATIDAAQLGYEREQLAAQQDAAKSRVNEVRQQISVLEAQ